MGNRGQCGDCPSNVKNGKSHLFMYILIALPKLSAIPDPPGTARTALTFSLSEKSIKIVCSIFWDVFRLIPEDFPGQSLYDGTEPPRDPQVSGEEMR